MPLPSLATDVADHCGVARPALASVGGGLEMRNIRIPLFEAPKYACHVPKSVSLCCTT